MFHHDWNAAHPIFRERAQKRVTGGDFFLMGREFHCRFLFLSSVELNQVEADFRFQAIYFGPNRPSTQ